jgi:uncharacterized protein YbjT (DUF2867 family)
MEFFETAGRNLLAAEAAAGVRHHVALSVVGTDRLLTSGYFRAKMAQENLLKASKIPFTIVRATQFFEFVRAIAPAGRGRRRPGEERVSFFLHPPFWLTMAIVFMLDVLRERS